MMMMFIRMGVDVVGHHKKVREVGKDRGWSIMKKQACQDVV